MKYTIEPSKHKNLYIVNTDELDPFSDSIQLYIYKNGDNCVVNDDGYTSYNFMCWGQTLTTLNDKDEISVAGKWSEKDSLINKEFNLVKEAYKQLKPIG